MEGEMLRSRCRYEVSGENPTKYFINLENRNHQDKVIQHLIDENGEEVPLRKRLPIRSIISVNYDYITVLCPFNLLIRFICYNTA